MTPTMWIRAIGVACACISMSASALAQTTDQPPNASLESRADSITVGDYCDVAQRVLAVPAVISALGADSIDARSNAIIICEPMLSSFSLLALTGRSPAPLKAIARVNRQGYLAAQKGVLEAMTQYRADVRGADVVQAIRAALGPELNAELVRISETAHGLVVEMARDRALERLANYERKLGPTSARLNFIETGLNYGAQRWIPGFKATPLGGPSPWELVASYTPGYATLVDGNAAPVSASEFGVRHYLFGPQFGKSGLAGLLMPSYWSAGMLTASDRNGALVWPWQGRDRSGAYVSWGAIKVGYIKRDRGSWLVSKQFQAVPLLF